MTIIFAAFVVGGTIGYAILEGSQRIADALDGLTVSDDDEEEDERAPWMP